MTSDDQTEHFANEIDKLITRFTSEYDLNYATAIGVLNMKIHLLNMEANEGDEVEPC